MVKAQRKWTEQEERDMIGMLQAGKDHGHIALKLNRTKGSVAFRIHMLQSTQKHGQIARPPAQTAVRDVVPARPGGPSFMRGRWWFYVDRRTAYTATIHRFDHRGVPVSLTCHGIRWEADAAGEWRATR